MTWSSVDLDSFCENEEVIGRREASDHISYRQWPMDRLSSLKWYYVKRSLRCFVHRLISPMHRTDVSIDASNFQPMNGIKQHLGESYHVRFVYVTRYRPICAIDRSRCAIYGSVVGASIDRSCSHRWIALRYRWMNTGQCFQVSGLGERSFWALGIVNVVEYWTYGHCHRIVEHL